MTSAAACLDDLDRRFPERLAWSPGYTESARWLVEEMLSIGADLEVDRAGNQWFSLRGRQDGFVVVGGHLDNAPSAEGALESLGLAVGLAAFKRLAADGPPPVTVRLVNWIDGTGVRFGRPFGASAAAGTMVDWFAAAELVDLFGSSLNDVAENAGLTMRLVHMARRLLRGMRAYVELGLEPASGSPVAVAGSAAGVTRCRLRWLDPSGAGGADTSGAARQFEAEVESVEALGPAVQLLDARDTSADTLEARLDAALEASDRIATEAGVAVEWRRVWNAAPVAFDETLTALAAEAMSAPTIPTRAQPGAAELARAGFPSAFVVLRDPSRVDLAEESFERVLDAVLEHAAKS
jgi:N-carbamoyl-L-amino-acid hydrolase